MRTQINNLKSLLEIQNTKEENERQLRLKLESESDHLVQKELERARIEITNQLTIAHKEELDTLKKRFKIVTQTTNMEHSLFDQNFEKNKVVFSNNCYFLCINLF